MSSNELIAQGGADWWGKIIDSHRTSDEVIFKLRNLLSDDCGDVTAAPSVEPTGAKLPQGAKAKGKLQERGIFGETILHFCLLQVGVSAQPCASCRQGVSPLHRHHCYSVGAP